MFDKVMSQKNLFFSARKVLGKKGAAGVDRQSVDDFDEHSRKELDRLHQQLREETVDSREKCFSFLGDSFRGRLRFPRSKSHKKVSDRIRALTPRKPGESLDCMIQRINRSLLGGFNYFRHRHWSIFEEYDAHIRKRLRRKRSISLSAAKIFVLAGGHFVRRLEKNDPQIAQISQI